MHTSEPRTCALSNLALAYRNAIASAAGLYDCQAMVARMTFDIGDG